MIDTGCIEMNSSYINVWGREKGEEKGEEKRQKEKGLVFRHGALRVNRVWRIEAQLEL